MAEGTWLRLGGFGIYSEASGSANFHTGSSLNNVTNDIDLEDTLGMDLHKFTGGGLVGFNFGPGQASTSTSRTGATTTIRATRTLA